MELLIVLVIGFGLYMIPTWIAWGRGHRQLLPLGIVNFFLGWTFLGWFGCLAWSFQRYTTAQRAEFAAEVVQPGVFRSCPKCKGAVGLNAETCPHCGATL